MFPPESIGGAPLPELPFFLPLLSRIACASALPSNYAANDVDPLCESSNFPDIVKLHRKIFMLPLFLQTRPSNSNRSKKSKNRILWKGRREKRRKKSRFNCRLLGRNGFLVSPNALFFDSRKKWTRIMGIRETIRAELRSKIVEYVKGSSEQVSYICSIYLDKIFVDDLAINSLGYDFLQLSKEKSFLVIKIK